MDTSDSQIKARLLEELRETKIKKKKTQPL